MLLMLPTGSCSALCRADDHTARDDHPSWFVIAAATLLPNLHACAQSFVARVRWVCANGCAAPRVLFGSGRCLALRWACGRSGECVNGPLSCGHTGCAGSADARLFERLMIEEPLAKVAPSAEAGAVPGMPDELGFTQCVASARPLHISLPASFASEWAGTCKRAAGLRAPPVAYRWRMAPDVRVQHRCIPRHTAGRYMEFIYTEVL